MPPSGDQYMYFFFWHPTPEQLGVAIVWMLGQFFDDLRLACRLQHQARQPLNDFFFPINHISDFRLQIPDSRFQISDSRFHILN